MKNFTVLSSLGAMPLYYIIQIIESNLKDKIKYNVCKYLTQGTVKKVSKSQQEYIDRKKLKFSYMHLIIALFSILKLESFLYNQVFSVSTHINGKFSMVNFSALLL